MACSSRSISTSSSTPLLLNDGNIIKPDGPAKHDGHRDASLTEISTSNSFSTKSSTTCGLQAARTMSQPVSGLEVQESLTENQVFGTKGDPVKSSGKISFKTLRCESSVPVKVDSVSKMMFITPKNQPIVNKLQERCLISKLQNGLALPNSTEKPESI